MDFNEFIGTWKVIGCNYMLGAEAADNQCLEGIKFKLDEYGDVTWFIPEDVKPIPLFNCETYELYQSDGVIIRFGAYAGHVLEFRTECVELHEKFILSCDGCIVLHCQRTHDESNAITWQESPFCLLPALDAGFFSDLVIKASNSKEFHVHSLIVELQGSGIDWHSDPPPFANMPEDVLGTILHFLYAECLPTKLTEAVARQVIDSVCYYPSLSKLVNKCKLYLKNMALKQQILSLVNDMHNTIDQIIENFNMKNSIVSDPSKLCFVVKQSIRDVAVVCVKLILFCNLFTQCKSELSRDERHEIIRYAKSRLPVFLMQLQSLLLPLKNTFDSMSATQRVEVATFLVPEIEVILDVFSTLMEYVERALEQIIHFLAADTRKKSGISDMLGKSLKNVLFIKELSKLRSFHEQVIYTYGLLVQKKETFMDMTSGQKVRSITRNLEQLIDVLPVIILRLEEVTAAFDEKLEWREFNFCFKVGTSKVSSILKQLVTHRDTLQEVMRELCKLVQRDAFSQSLLNLGLLDAENVTSNSVGNDEVCTSTPKHHGCKLNLVEALSIPPDSSNSVLSSLLLKLFQNPINADMEFEVVTTTSSHDQSGSVVDDSHVDVKRCDLNEEEEKTMIKAHRVIVATRCDWFRRALQSGMRESIDKKIIIHDTNPIQFKLFLEYLYSGRLNQYSNLVTEQLIELLLLSDRYEVDSLKQICESALEPSIDLDSALYFLNMADQYNAKILKNSCLSFISQHNELTENEIFFELPIALQAEVFDCIWTQTTTSSQNSIKVHKHLPSNAANTQLLLDMENFQFHSSGIDSVGQISTQNDARRMDDCLSQLREIIPGASQEELIQIILAADYNLCRAVNFYYTRKSSDEDEETESV